MAVKIPHYQSHVQLDSGAQTVPRFSANDQVGRALMKAGDSLSSVAAQWKKKQEHFEDFQMSQRAARAKAAISDIAAEETAKFDPGVDPPGTLHDRIAARTKPIIDGMVASAPDRLRPYYAERGQTTQEEVSVGAAQKENAVSVQYFTGVMDKLASGLAGGVKAKPESFEDATKQLIHSIESTPNLTTVQRRAMVGGYTKMFAGAAVEGYKLQGRTEEGRTFINKMRDLEEQSSQDAPPVRGLNPSRVQAINDAAGQLGIEPKNLAAVISYETGGKFDPGMWGGKGNNYLGLIQFGPQERARFGVREGMTFEEQMPSVVAFLKERGLKPGMDVAHLYSIINAGSLNRNGEPRWAASDGNGTVATHVDKIQSQHLTRIAPLFGGGAPVPTATTEAKPKVTYDNDGRMIMSNARPAAMVTADAGGNIIGGMQVGGSPKAAAPDREVNLKAANAALKLTNQEYALYREHLGNLYGQGGVDNDGSGGPNLPKGSRSTLFQTSAEHDGKFYNVPTVWDGKIHSEDEAAARAEKLGWGKYPSYETRDAAEARYTQMHDFMDKDTNAFIAQRSAGQSQGGTPDSQNVGDPISPTANTTLAAGQPPKKMTAWSVWADTMHATLDAAEQKAALKDKTMVARLNSIIESDINSIRNTGKPVMLDHEMAEHFGTQQLNHELISARAGGEGKAQTWEDDRQIAQRVYNAMSDAKVAPISAIRESYQSLMPRGGEQDYTRRLKVYNEVLKTSEEIIKKRLNDPAAAADALPEVQAALKKANSNPTDNAAAQELVAARIKAQGVLGVPPHMQSPITDSEAAAIAAPLTDILYKSKNPANSTGDSAKDAAAEVMKNMKRLVGDNEDMLHSGLARILQEKGLAKDRADAVASAFALTTRIVSPTDTMPKESKGWRDRFDTSTAEGAALKAAHDNRRRNPPPITGTRGEHNADPGMWGNFFEPEKQFIPSDHIQKLQGDPSLADVFDSTYGIGGAKHFLDQAPATGAQSVDEAGFTNTSPFSPKTPEDL